MTGQGELSAANRELLLSHEFWRTKFASEPGIVGASITLDDESYTVVGVLPPGRPWLDAAQVFAPRVRNRNLDRTGFGVMVIGRLAPGVSIETDRLDLESIFRRLQTIYPELREESMGFLIKPASEWVAGARLRRSLWVLLAAVGFILLIASVNLTHLLLARATARQRETAIRAALGAGRGRLVRQFLAESLVLGLIGAGAGLLLAVGAIQLLKVFDPGDIPRLAEVTIDRPVLGFTLAIGLLSGVLAGLVPAFQVPYGSLINVLRGGDRHFVAGKTERFMRSALVVPRSR